MKTRVRLLCLFLALACVLFYGMPVGVAAFPDVNEDSVFYEAIQTLSSLGLLKGYEDGTFKPEGTITRAEFATVMTRVLGMENVPVTSGGMVFNDVSTEHWAWGYIQIAAALGIIKGFGDGSFLPDEPVTYEQAVKMIVAALGYEPKATEKGGYPAGYLMIAKEENITKKAEGQVGQPAARGLVAQLLFNSLEVPMLEVSSVGDSTTYVVNKDKTFLSRGLKLIRVKDGQITGTKYTTLESPITSIRDDEIEIDGMVFKTNDSEMLSQYLGYMVTYYYRYDTVNNVNELVYVLPSDKNKKVVLKPDNIEKYENNTLYYSLNEEQSEKIYIREDITIIYNGKKYNNEAPISLDIPSGEVALLDCNDDNNYDVLFINEYQTYIVENTPNTSDYIIIDKFFGTKLTIDPYDKNTVVTILKGGRSIQFSEIKKGDILSVIQSINTQGKKILKVLVAENNTVTGKITEIRSDNKIIINDTQEYRISDYYLKAISEKGKSNVKVDDEGTFYLDVEGKIVDLSLKAAKAANYAYLIHADIKNSALEGMVQLKLYIPTGTTSGSVQIKDCAEKVKVDGKTLSSASDILGALEDASKITNTDPMPEKILRTEDLRRFSQIIKYTTNNSGQIDNIDTLSDGGYGEPSEHLRLVYADKDQELKYYSTNRTFRVGEDVKFTIDSSTKVFYVPQNRSQTEKYSMKGLNYFVNGRSYRLEAFDFTSVNVAKAVVLYGDDTDQMINETTPVVIVDGYSTVLNDQGEQVIRLSYHHYQYTDKQTVDIKKSDSELEEQVKTLVSGDIIRFSIKESKYIADLDILLKVDTMVSYRDKQENNVHYGYRQGDFRAVYGAVYSKDADNNQILVYDKDKLPGENEEFEQSSIVTYNLSDSNIKYYLVRRNASNNQVQKKESIEDLYLIDYFTSKQDVSKVFLYTYEDKVRMIIKIEE